MKAKSKRKGEWEDWVGYYRGESVFPREGAGWDGVNEGSVAAIPVASLE